MVRITSSPLIAVALLLAAALAGVPQRAAAQDLNGAVIVQYHRFGENDVPATNIRLEQFEEQLAELKKGQYTVLPLAEIVDALRTGRKLPDRTVAITIDDAYTSSYTQAWPRLKAAGFPFTIFVSTDIVDARTPRYLSWAQIKEMADAGVTIGGHGAAHGHMPDLTPDAIAADLARSARSYQEHLGKVPTLFAYPFGEMSLLAREAVQKAGYVAAFGQHSGVADAGGDMYFQPRFAFDEAYGTIDRFVLAVNALPMGAREMMPLDPVLRGTANPPAFGFTVAPGVTRVEQVNCFPSNGAAAKVERLDRRIEVRLDKPYAAGGYPRINCTVQAGNNRWRWFGYQFYVPAK